MNAGHRQFVLPASLPTFLATAFTGEGLDQAYLQEVQRNISEHIRNLTRVLGALNATVDARILAQFSSNRKLDDPVAFYSLVTAYTLLIVIGAAGNSLVVCAVVRKPAMRTARNMFIVNLAVSDLLLCLVTMPLTLMEILTKYWPLGRQAFVCKILGTLQATSIFVSTISITAIALDRYQVIVYPTRESLQRVGAVVILSCIWIVSIILAMPMYLWRTLKHHDINLPDVAYISYCLEEWPVEHGRAYYSIFSLIFQYLLPIITVTVAYSRICHKLRYRFVNPSVVNSAQGKRSKVRKQKCKDDHRMRRTNSLLYSIALIFCVSWMPLNIFNVVLDLWYPFGSDQGQTMIICYAVCHMVGMSSACSNPLLYGWLNENFRKEFREIASLCACRCARSGWSAIWLRMEAIGSSSDGTRRGTRRQGANAGAGGRGDGVHGGRAALIVSTAADAGDGEPGVTTRLVEASAEAANVVSRGGRGRRGTETDNGVTTSAHPDTEMTLLSRA